MDLRRMVFGLGFGLIVAGVPARSSWAAPQAPAEEPPSRPTAPAPPPAPGPPEAVRPSPAAPAQPGTARPAPPRPAPAPPSPTAPPGAPGFAAAPGAAAPYSGAAANLFRQGPGGLPSFAALPARGIPEMMGDQGALSALQFLPPPVPQVPTVPGGPPARQSFRGAALLPSIRQFKIAEMESPMPLDRAYVSFNYYDNLNASINQRLGADVSGLRVYREIFGLEKTFWDRRASIGLRLPLNTLTADSRVPGLGGSNTSVGDMAVILKYAILQNRETGDVLSAGALITAPTGPSAFAGAPGIARGYHDATIQPYVGFIKTSGEFYLQGFSSVDVPVDRRDVTVYYNDLGAGYFVYHDRESNRLITGLAPTLEAHVTTPLNHRGFSPTDRVGTPDVLDLTYGLNVEVRGRSYARFGLVTPVTGPRPFALEAFVQYTMRF